MVPRGRIARHGEADAARDLRVQVDVRDGVVEAIPDGDELILIDAIDDDWRRGVAVAKPLKLLCHGRAPAELESRVRHGVVLRRLEDIQSARIGRANVLELDRRYIADLFRTGRLLRGISLWLGCLRLGAGIDGLGRLLGNQRYGEEGDANGGEEQLG